jgi:hypothetical protein
MRQVNNNSSVYLRKLILCAYASSAMALLGVIFSMDIFISILAVFCIALFFLK